MCVCITIIPIQKYKRLKDIEYVKRSYRISLYWSTRNNYQSFMSQEELYNNQIVILVVPLTNIFALISSKTSSF